MIKQWEEKFIEKWVDFLGITKFGYEASKKLGIDLGKDYEKKARVRVKYLLEDISNLIKEEKQKYIKICGNAGGNVVLTFKGGCRGKLNIKDGYRCTGCGGWFHKDCIKKHFELEKNHDWGRKQERATHKKALKEEKIKAIYKLTGKAQKIMADREFTEDCRAKAQDNATKKAYIEGKTVGLRYGIRYLEQTKQQLIKEIKDE